MENVHGLNDYNKEVSNGYKPGICPISGQIIVIPCILEDRCTYDYFTLVKALYDDLPILKKKVNNTDEEVEYIISPKTGEKCSNFTVSDDLYNLMKNNISLKDLGKDFKFSRNTLLKCVQYLCGFDRDYIIRQYGLPNNWDVSNVSSVENLFSIFKYTQYFDYDISNWDLSGVKNLSGFSHMFYGNIGMKSNFIKNLTVEQYKVILDTGFENNPYMRNKLQDLIKFSVNINVYDEKTNIKKEVYSNTNSKFQKRLSQEEMRLIRINRFDRPIINRTNVEEQQNKTNNANKAKVNDVDSKKKNGDTKKKRSFFGRNPFKKK